jgi:poly(3-hydroxybutyrate) depolymerase
MTRQVAILTIAAMIHAPSLIAGDISSMKPDLATPSATDNEPAPGERVRQVNNIYAGTEVHHLLYLPTDWKKGEKYPVIVEFSGNKWKNSQGTVDECDLGYGISGGKGVIWICMPFVDKKNGKNAATWWGDVEATVDYCKQTVRRICSDYGGDSSKVFIAGFSRGSIACNYIGLHDDEIASLWQGFICHSHYDGVRRWGYKGSDKASALV